MLSVPKLDDLSYDELIRRARSRIPLYTGDWTDFNDHDPGITTLQTFAWLVDTLNYYIDATGEEHRLKYLSLLGLEPERAAARVFVALSGKDKQLVLARGAKLMAGDTTFETAASCVGIQNGIRALYQETGGAFTDLTPFAGVDGEYAAILDSPPEHESAAYIGFGKGLGEEVRFYADILPHPARNPFEDDFALCKLKWEFFDGRHWCGADLRSDGTYGFLKSGFVTLGLERRTVLLKGHPVLPEAHYLRVSISEGQYDAPPKIGRIYVNCVEAVQTETRAQALEIEFDGNPALAVDYHVRENDVVCVAVEDEDGYSLWFEHTADEASLCEVVRGSYPWQRVIRFDREKFGAFPEAGQRILVTVTDADWYEKLQLGVTTGFSRQRMELDLKNLYELRLALIGEKNGRAHLRLWDQCGSLAGAACDERVFAFDHGTGEVVFGDAIAGLQPDAGQLVVAVTAKTSLLDAGNVRAGQINRLSDEAYAHFTVYNPREAEGGKRAKTSAELENEIERKIYKTTRAVTAEDYIHIVKATPGLMIDSVNVISSGSYARFYGGGRRPNMVFLAVKPWSEDDPRPVLSEAYRRRIRENIEQYRLITTDVQILPAKYVNIDVDGRIVLVDDTPLARRRVEERLSQLIDFTHVKKFKPEFICGRIFSNLEMLDCVSKVTHLSLSCIGDGAHKNEQGDIVVYPDALAFLRGVNIEFA